MDLRLVRASRLAAADSECHRDLAKSAFVGGCELVVDDTCDQPLCPIRLDDCLASRAIWHVQFAQVWSKSCSRAALSSATFEMVDLDYPLAVIRDSPCSAKALR
jgi:hypothetical protein